MMAAGSRREPSATGFGMTSMQERADRIGASLTIVTAPRNGTEVVLAWDPALTADTSACATPEASPAVAKARVLLVDDHALLRTGVANIINQEPDLRVVAEAENGVEAIDAYERHQPDVTLLDLRMPVMEGVEVVRQIRERDPRARVIILTTYDTDDEISQALKAGAKAYVLKDISADDLVGCIRDVLAGKTYLAPAAAAKLAEGVTRVQLTPREMATLTPARRRQGEQGNRERARHQRAHRQDPSRSSVRETRRDQPDRSDQSRDTSRPGAFGISPRREATEIASVCDAAPILEYSAASRCSISHSDKPRVIASWAVDRPAASD